MRLHSWREYRVKHSLPYSRVVSTQAWYTVIFVLMVSMELSHALFDRRAIADEALPILEFSSVSKLRLLEMMEPR